VFTTGSKWFFGLAAAALLGAMVYGGATNPNEVGMSTLTGVLTLGYKGGVGDHLGVAILMGIAGAAVFLGASTAAFRDSSVEAGSQLLALETVPEVTAPERGSYWPILGALGAGIVALGLVTSAPLVILGAGILAITVFEWAISAWADRATGDDEVNRSIRRRVMLPFEVPIIGAIGIGVFVLAISRILLALPSLGVYLLFGLVPLLVLTIAFVLAAKPRINRQVVAGICVIAGLAVLAGGIAAAIVGPQPVEHHGEEEEHGAPALDPSAPVTLPGSVR
jgi:hypothetical protein